MSQSKIRLNVRVPLALKLAALTGLMVLAATIPIAIKSSMLFKDVSSRREEDLNLAQSESKATELEHLLTALIEKIKVVAPLVLQEIQNNPGSPTVSTRTGPLYFLYERETDLVSLEIHEIKQGDKPKKLFQNVKKEFVDHYKLDPDYITTLRVARPFPILSLVSGNVEIINSSLEEGAPLLTIGFPFVKNELSQVTHVVIADINLGRIQRAFRSTNERLIFAVTKDGTLLAHPDESQVLKTLNKSHLPVVQKAMTSMLPRGQMRYADPEDQMTYVSAFTRLGLGLIVVTQASENLILEPARYVQREGFFITGMVLSSAIFIVFIFSMTLTRPIEKLVDLSHRIARGVFDVQATREIQSRDELGDLAIAFDDMTTGLKEREKIKKVLNKFHGSSIAENLLQNDIAVSGQVANVTIFFSDIRGFTAYSEAHSPEEVVGMLNEYFKVMVSIIQKNHGIVDKFIGDAIMAVWGAPKSTGHDAYYAVKSCIEMRLALNKLNRRRSERGQLPIWIGMGLHSGSAISGTIGSDERMEYTVIGDTVNLTSRIEGATKHFGTDLLISESTAKLVEKEFILEEIPAAHVKGFSNAMIFFRVVGYIDDKGEKILVETPYSAYPAEESSDIKAA